MHPPAQQAAQQLQCADAVIVVALVGVTGRKLVYALQGNGDIMGSIAKFGCATRQ